MFHNKHNIHNAGYIIASDEINHEGNGDTYIFANNAAVQFKPGVQAAKQGQVIDAHFSPDRANEVAKSGRQNFGITNITLRPFNNATANVKMRGTINFMDDMIDFYFQGSQLILETINFNFEKS